MQPMNWRHNHAILILWWNIKVAVPPIGVAGESLYFNVSNVIFSIFNVETARWYVCMTPLRRVFVSVAPPSRCGGCAVLWHRSGSLYLQQPLRGVHQTHQAGRASPLPACQSIYFNVMNLFCLLRTPGTPALSVPAGSTAGQMAQWSVRCDLNQGCLRTSFLAPLFSVSGGVSVIRTATLHDTFLFFSEFPAPQSCFVSEKLIKWN